MDQDTHQDMRSLILELLLEDVNDNIDRHEAKLLLNDTNQSANRLEEVEPIRGVALHIWKSEIERQRALLSDFQIATVLSLREEERETSLPKEMKTLAKFISTFIQKLVLSLKNIMGYIQAPPAAGSPQPEVCTSCGEVYSEVFKTQCSHSYCKDCLIRMVTKSLEEVSLFPTQCCHKEIEGSEMKKMIGTALALEYKKRQTELSDPDRTYCSDLACSQYILRKTKFWPNSTSKTVSTCNCGVRTCRKCKKHAHRGRCLYQLDKSFEKLIKQNEWQRRTKCGRVIELNEGCPHITMCNFNMGTTISMGPEIENDLAKYERKRSSKSLPIAIQKLGGSLENAIDLDGSPKSEIWHECVSRWDEQLQDDMHKTKCSHFYCKACLIRLFTDSLRDESLFPPQCCHKSIVASEKMLGPALVQKHKEKVIELSDPDRTYCCNPKCAEYLPRKITQNGICKCASCGVRTCRKCKKHAHEGKCVYKPDALLEELAECKKWQRCSNCSRLIELSTGCNHITCICKFEFCYFCGKPWKTCKCIYAEEENLYERP
ncbi:Zinc finger RING/FYVE/PHD-type [Penicillium fimorum]|uniref:RBR-type E3 ubiquitin transferase n=1 Tax=Penicillium fimorum TaxID=1882269 RepID=A0A9X0C936_9EURO|nr:Zinc finger RING/FYVE/PHD-type [Penicillium fimorum]